jgi:glutamate dehydrogenase (NAD(P)+)
MAWMMDQYTQLAGRAEFGCITGKPRTLGGSAGRGDATARGGLAAVREAAAGCGLDLSQATVAIQGYGNAGYHAACLLKSLFGARIVAVSDSGGAVFSAAGIDPEQAGLHKMRTSSVVAFPGTEPLPPAEILTLDADILIPAALEHVITESNASRVRARIVAELANGPTTPEAADILHRNGIHVIPDFLCNAGGVIVSYFEMTQNFFADFRTEADVHSRLDQRMTEAYHAVLAASRRYNINTQQAAYVVAVERVAEAMRLRGWV